MKNSEFSLMTKITLLIPTMNRSDFLIRLLRYYWELGFQGCICIGDSSDAADLERTKRAIEVFQEKLNIDFKEYPGLSDADCLQQLIKSVSTPYAALVPDDDFLVPAALEQCALFLDQHPDYNAAHGKGLAVGLKSDGAHGEVAWVLHYKQTAVEGETAAERLCSHLSNYSVALFSVHRIESWREMYKDVFLLTKRLSGELLPCCLSVIQGKMKEMDCLYVMRQSHNKRYSGISIKKWTGDKTWLSSYQIFRDCLAKELTVYDGISIDEAREVVDQAFSSYLASLPAESWLRQYAIPRLLQFARYVPGARQVWRTSRLVLRSMNLIGRDEIPLTSLLDSSSPYHADFMSIYRAMTDVPAEFPEDRPRAVTS